MALNLEGKKQVVEEVSALAQSALAVVAAEYRGLSAAQMSDLRGAARAANVSVRVVKNTLAVRALAGSAHESMAETLTGPLVLLFSTEDHGSAAKITKEFAKKNDKLKVRSLSIGSGVLGAERLDAIAALPNRDQAIAMLMSVMKAPVGKLARTLAAVRDAKEAA
jgi:large subunit ribosomal protein L10